MVAKVVVVVVAGAALLAVKGWLAWRDRRDISGPPGAEDQAGDVSGWGTGRE